MDNEELNYLSNLAKLELTDDERATLVEDLDQILAYINQLNELETKDVLLDIKTGLMNVGRVDEINPDHENNKETRAENLKQGAFLRDGDYLKIPPIFS